ncbi:MAG TPA: 7-carboxy-7-deazaguanine synthase QueE [Acidimicrobiales bacterium]|nr:7-carboxy-7-deazaguanine synthase QueE [Acidimicrobiales bacterium]
MTTPTLAISEIFGPTVQGEGPTAGRRAAFVRLGRCNLDCVWCDTPYTWDWDRYDPAVEVTPTPVAEVVARLDAMAVARVVVTGGEPLLQQRGLVPLLGALGERGWAVEVETNGTIAPTPAVAAAVTAFNVSPKLANSGIAPSRRIRPAALGALVETGKAAFKFVVAEPSELDEVASLVAAHGLAPVWIMPEGTSAAVVSGRLAALADEVVARGWNLTTRLHVVLWGDERGR